MCFLRLIRENICCLCEKNIYIDNSVLFWYNKENISYYVRLLSSVVGGYSYEVTNIQTA